MSVKLKGFGLSQEAQDWMDQMMAKPLPPQKPTLGRIVRYVGKDRIERAAIVSTVSPEGLGLHVLVPGPWPVLPFERVGYDKDKGMNSWHWPERE